VPERSVISRFMLAGHDTPYIRRISTLQVALTTFKPMRNDSFIDVVVKGYGCNEAYECSVDAGLCLVAIRKANSVATAEAVTIFSEC
jgi:hypothetical protein